MRSLLGAALATLAACGDSVVPVDAVSTLDAAADAAPDAAPVITCQADPITRIKSELERGRDLLLAYQQQHGQFPAETTAATPTASCCAQNAGGLHCCAAIASDWNAGVWPTIGFAQTEPQEFQFSYEGNASAFELWARADRDCDGVQISYVMTCSFTMSTPVECRLLEPAPGVMD